jgi:hypothetical protein
MTTDTDHQPLTDERLAEIDARAAGLFEYVTLPSEADQLAGVDVPALITEVKRQRANLEQSRRGGKELGKSVEFLGGLIKDAFLRGADDPIGALHMLGDFLSNLFEDEGGLTVEEHNRVYRALEDQRAKLAKDHNELRDKRSDLLNVRGVLSPQGRSLGLGPVVPMPLGEDVAPAVEWLANEADRLREENARLRADLGRPLTDNERSAF